MLIEDWMSKKPLTVRASAPPQEARKLMTKSRIRQLPVVERGKLVGIVTDRDLRSATEDPKRVDELMTYKPQTIEAEESVDTAAHLMRTWKINALPVMRKNKMVGILTTTDVLDAFVAYSGVAEPSYRLVIVPAPRASLEKIKKLMNDARAEVRWVRARGKGKSREVQARVVSRDIDAAVTALEAAGHGVSCVVTSAGQRP